MTSPAELGVTVLGLFVGRVENRWEGRPPSAIVKHPTTGSLQLGPNGFEQDEQADRSVHGGPDKAVHHYASDHYAAWRRELSDSSFNLRPGSFGENLSTSGITEGDVCIGDIFQLGSARVQISQGRQPCWKLNAHVGEPTMAARFQKTGRTGWYYRVLETGTVELGNELRLVDRPQPGWPLDRVIQARFDPRLDREAALALSRIPELAEGWRLAFARKSERKEEDATKRLVG